MTDQKPVHLIAFVGLTGSGKSTAVEYLTEKGYPKAYFGGVLYKAMNDAGIEITWESQKKFRENIRKREGKDFIVKCIIKEVHDLIDAGHLTVILDGLYTWSEYKILKHEFPGELITIAVVTPKHKRYQRMQNRPERPMQPHEVDERDWAEIENLEKGGPIAIADHYIENAGTLEAFYAQIDKLLPSVEL